MASLYQDITVNLKNKPCRGLPPTDFLGLLLLKRLLDVFQPGARVSEDHPDFDRHVAKWFDELREMRGLFVEAALCKAEGPGAEILLWWTLWAMNFERLSDHPHFDCCVGPILTGCGWPSGAEIRNTIRKIARTSKANLSVKDLEDELPAELAVAGDTAPKVVYRGTDGRFHYDRKDLKKFLEEKERQERLSLSGAGLPADIAAEAETHSNAYLPEAINAVKTFQPKPGWIEKSAATAAVWKHRERLLGENPPSLREIAEIEGLKTHTHLAGALEELKAGYRVHPDIQRWFQGE